MGGMEAKVKVPCLKSKYFRFPSCGMEQKVAGSLFEA